MFVVGIHRLAILNERPSSLFYIRFQREEIKYLATIIIGGLGLLLISAIIGAISYIIVMAIGLEEVKKFFNSPEVLSFFTSRSGIAAGIALYVLVIIFILWIGARLLLAFPHAAVTGKIDFGLAWRTMRGNFWRYFAVVVIFSLIGLVIYAVLLLVIFGVIYGLAQIFQQQNVPGAISQGGANWQTILISSIPILLITAVFGFLQAAAITMISMSYKALILRNYETAA